MTRDEWLARVVASAPPLTEEKRQELRRLLAPFVVPDGDAPTDLPKPSRQHSPVPRSATQTDRGYAHDLTHPIKDELQGTLS